MRFIRSNCQLDISPDLQYEYVVATINVKEQKLKVFQEQFQVDEFDYKLR